MTNYMNTLDEVGVIVLPYPTHIRNEFDTFTFLTEQKEFKDASAADSLFVMGGFGALGNPSSFNHPLIRQLRLSMFEFMKPNFAKLYKGKYIQTLVDRFAIRRAGTSLSPETWHRDVSNVNKNGEIVGEMDDIIYGGWVNLDTEQSQFFSCVPNTHKDDFQKDGAGFSKLSKEESAEYKLKRVKFEIPPGHMIIFNEKTVHEVCPTKCKNVSCRLFMKYRISNTNTSLFPNSQIDEICTQQGVFPLSCVQMPPMYAKLHRSNWKDRLEAFSKTVCDEYIDPAVKYTCVKRVMPSLYEVGSELFSEYLQKEKDILYMQLL